MATGAFSSWRGSETEIAGTWADDNTNMVNFWQLQTGGEFATWDKPIDVAIGAIGWDESWSAAATGSYDARWTKSLSTLKKLRGERTGTVYIRFAHEMNGNWYPWSVNQSNSKAFVASWKRFRALQQQYYPEAQLVFSVNRESVGTGMDWRDFFPGKAFVDVLSVDYYNQYPYVATTKDWDESLSATDQYGAPKGLTQHLKFAESVGLPLAVSEWGGVATEGDSPVFVSQMHAFLQDHAGGGAGQVLYDIYFNVGQDEGKFLIFGEDVKMPRSADAYRSLF